MRVHFRVARWKNLCATGNEFIEIKLDEVPRTLLVGENGHGKSTILEAICLALFNRSFRNVNKPELVNWTTGKGCVAEVEFTVAGEDFLVRRGIKPNLFEIYRNGKLVNQNADSRDYQADLEKHILRINYKSFCQVVVLGTASFVPFLKLPKWTRREVVEDILDLEVFTAMNSLLNRKFSELETLLQKKLTDKKVAETKVQMAKESARSAATSKQSMIDDLLGRIEDAEANVKTHLDTAEKIEKENSVDYGKEIQELEKKVEEASSVFSKMEAKTASLQKSIAFFESHASCPTCSQAMGRELRESAVTERNAKIIELEAAQSKLLEMRQKIYDDLRVVRTKSGDRQAALAEASMHRSAAKSWVKYASDTKRDVSKLEADKEESYKIDALIEELRAIEEEYSGYLKTKTVMDNAGLILKDNGIKAKIVKQYVPIINKLVNKYAALMGFFGIIELNEEFQDVIRVRDVEERSYESLSEGERFRINLAVLFTWRVVARLRSSMTTNLLIMDEVMDGSLDFRGTDEFMKILEDMRGEQNVVVMSHKVDQLVDKFDRVYKFCKVKHFTKMEAIV